MPRPCKCRRVGGLPPASYFKPAGIPLRELEEILLSVDGLEALRLADAEGLTMAEAAGHMHVSRHTFGRILAKARRCVAEALLRGHALRVEGGHYRLAAEGETGAESTGQPCCTGHSDQSEAPDIADMTDAPHPQPPGEFS